MDPDPARRPQSIEQLRDLLGIVPLGPPVGAAVASHMTPPMPPDAPAPAPAPAPDLGPAIAPPEAVPPAFMQAAERPRRTLNLNRWQRWAVAAGGGAVLIALALAMFAEMRDSGSFDHVVLTLPQQADKPSVATGAAAAGALDSGEGYVAPDSAAASPAAIPQSPANPAAPIAAGQAQSAPDTRLPGVVVTPNGNVYKLQIQPWGVVYVDDVDRGVSPPVKRLVLAPGRHTIRVTNPNFHDRVLEVDTASSDGQITVDFTAEP
jgi:hypothetical protein